MTGSVESVVREHLQANDAVQEPIEWSEIVARLELEVPLVDPAAERSRRVWIVAAVAAVVTVLLVGVVPFLVRSNPAPPTDPVVSTTSAEMPAFPVWLK